MKLGHTPGKRDGFGNKETGSEIKLQQFWKMCEDVFT